MMMKMRVMEVVWTSQRNLRGKTKKKVWSRRTKSKLPTILDFQNKQSL